MPDSELLSRYLQAIDDGGGSNDACLLRGQFHDVVVRGDVAYRFPRDEKSRRLLPARIALLRALRQCDLPVAIPGLLSDVAAGRPLGRSYAVLQRVPGRPAAPDLRAGGSATAAVVSDLAALLERLSELGADGAVRAAVPPADSQSWRRFADDVSRILFPLMSRDGQRKAEAELDRVTDIDPTGNALVHGDLGGTNLLWADASAGAHLVGVLDWDEAHLGNQADDLASIAVTLGWPVAAAVDVRRHGAQTPMMAEARAVAATFALQQALPAALSGDKDALDDGLSSYR